MTARPYTNPDPQLVEKYGTRQGSFYTFYPMNGLWPESITAADYRQALEHLIISRPDAPLSLYLHFPFCFTQCLFCHCYTVISKDKQQHSRFIDYLLKEIDLLKAFFKKHGFRPNVREIHFGGGSPSIIENDDFKRICDKLSTFVTFDALFECTIEIDPRYNMSVDRLAEFHSFGIDRISFGIQDFDTHVGSLINRVNPPELIDKLLTPQIRSLYDSINFDLIYGLPEQTPAKFDKTVEEAIRLSPDRLAVYVLGFRPDLYKHHKALKKYYLADAYESSCMFVSAVNQFIDNGYEFIGIDHLAKQHDVLAKAKREGTLFRNAIGYTPGRSVDIIPIGPSSMGMVGPHYFQNFYTLPSYFESIDREQLPIVRGFVANDDDVVRRKVMFDFVLYEKVSKADISNIIKDEEFDTYFSTEINTLKEFVDDGLIIDSGDELRITDLGRFYQRQICQVFDLYDRQHGYSHSREFSDGKRALTKRNQLV